ncbi:hypothetical protein [Maribacter sp. 2-571]|uniref:hypothetical protein n=1 Tax=Maribacter sp. 2-571 TaxID=3417569 RepID=UPI003D32E78A
MKRTMPILALLFLVIACSKNDSPPSGTIRFEYAEEEINTTFRTVGSIAPSIIQWNGEVGTYSITSSSEILQRNHIVFDSLTGLLSWGKDFPLGTYDFVITAESEGRTQTVEILLINTLTKAFFSGGLQMVDPDAEDLNYSEIPPDYSLSLNEDGTIYMERYSNPAFEASGTWAAVSGGSLLIEFTTNLSGGDVTYMRGFLSNSLNTPSFLGTYGSGIDENQEIVNRIGIFRFEWD